MSISDKDKVRNFLSLRVSDDQLEAVLGEFRETPLRGLDRWKPLILKELKRRLANRNPNINT